MRQAFGYLQQIGRALMTPVSVLPAAGLLLRFGDQDLLNSPVIKNAGGVIFDNLPVPIATAVSALVLGLVFGYVWPPVQAGIDAVSRAALNSGPFGPFFFGFGQRILIPFGLHHIFYQPFWYVFGSFTSAAGEVVRGDMPRFFAGDPTAGRFLG